MNISLHFEHHLNMCVPWYLLPRFQRDIAAVVPIELRDRLYVTRLRDFVAQLRGVSQAPLVARHPRVVDTTAPAG